MRDTRLSNGDYLVTGRHLTGFSWREEVLDRVDKLVRYNIEAETQEIGADYTKAKVPFVSHGVVDGTLVTGQNPASAKKTASKVAALVWPDLHRSAISEWI